MHRLNTSLEEAMPKIQNVGVGKFIRNPRGRRGADSRMMNVEVLQIAENGGNSFLCYPVTDAKTVPVTVDTTRFLQIPIDTVVDQVSI
jgi:hypothetical protein